MDYCVSSFCGQLKKEVDRNLAHTLWFRLQSWTKDQIRMVTTAGCIWQISFSINLFLCTVNCIIFFRFPCSLHFTLWHKSHNKLVMFMQYFVLCCSEASHWTGVMPVYWISEWEGDSGLAQKKKHKTYNKLLIIPENIYTLPGEEGGGGVAWTF